MELEAGQEGRQIEARRARENLHRWKMKRGCLMFLIYLGFNVLLVIVFVAAAPFIFSPANSVYWMRALLLILEVGCAVAIMVPYSRRLKQLEQAWFSTYGTEVMATVMAKRQVPGKGGEGTSVQLQLAWSAPTGGEALSFWEPVAPVRVKRYPPGTGVRLRYDPADLSFHRIRWEHSTP